MSVFIRNLRSIQFRDDPNDYRVGHLESADPDRPHRIALTTMPEDNTRNAAVTCADMLRSFPRIRCVVMTGIAGGVPAPTRPEWHVRLGDVVVAVDGIVDYGHVRQGQGSPQPRRPVAGVSVDLKRAVVRLQERAYRGDLLPWRQLLAPAEDQPMAVFARPPSDTDQLHTGTKPVEHPPTVLTGHREGEPKIHYGRIGCADILLKDEKMRDDLAATHNVIAFEMEGAGVATSAANRGISWFMVRGIVDYCDRYKSDRWHPYASLTAAGAVRAILAEARPFPVLRLAPGSGVIALLTDQEYDRLLPLLDEVNGLDARELWRIVTGGILPLPNTPQDLGALAVRLAAYNARPDRLPPVLAFVEEIALRAGVPLAARLRRWADQVADRLALDEVVAVYRGRDGGGPDRPVRRIPPCLLIQIETDEIDPDLYEIRYWIQRWAERWQPEPSEPRTASARQLEQFVQEAIEHAETVWRDGGPVEIELILPTDLLSTAVEWWHTELNSPDPTPLCLDYPIVVRSLDRMRAMNRRRVWANRWRALWTAPAGHRLHLGRRHAGETDLHLWNTQLRADQEITTAILRMSPQQEEWHHEMRSALNAGVPVLVWDRRSLPADEETELLAATADVPSNLPRWVRARRVEAARLPPPERQRHPGRHLALLWDDPDRNVYEGGPLS